MNHEVMPDQSKNIPGNPLPDVEPVLPPEKTPEIQPIVIDKVLDRLNEEDKKERIRQIEIERLRHPRTLH